MKKLTVFWTKYSIPKAGAETRRYKKTPMRTDFPEDTIPEVAIESIKQEHGVRPFSSNPFKIIARAHSFAEIDSHRIHEVFEREREAEVKYEDQDLLTPEMMEACKTKDNPDG